MKKYLNILAKADTSTMRTATLAGDEYLVVDCIALVEGVLQGAAASVPELALATEFGKVVDGWNSRPLVLNHPKVNGQFVSANSPEVLEAWSFGYIFNAKIEDDKLKVEAWISRRRVNELGGEFAEITAAIESGEMVEVSTGLFTDLVSQKGMFNGEKYEKIWINVVPDHLAILSIGTIGACSIEDGCGIPRLNVDQYLEVNSKIPDIRVHTAMSSASKVKTVSAQPSAGAPVVANCGCKNTPANVVLSNDPAVVAAQQAKDDRPVNSFNARMDAVAAISANSVPADMPDKNVRILLNHALSKKIKEDSNNQEFLYYIHMFTANEVVYEEYYSAKNYILGFNVSSDFTVEFIGEPRDVAILSQIVPMTSSDDGALSTNGDVNQETKMSDNAKAKESQEKAPKVNNTGAEVQGSEAQQEAAVVTSQEEQQGQVEQANPITVEQYINSAPAEIKDLLVNAIAVQKEARGKFIAEIKGNSNNPFTDVELAAKPTPELEKLAKFMASTSYVGNAPPVAGQVIVNADPDAIPAPPKVFKAKTAA